MMLMGISVPFREVSLLRKPLGLEHVIWREVSLLVSTEKAMRRPQAMKWATIGFTLFVFLDSRARSHRSNVILRMQKLVKVVIPLYKEELDDVEIAVIRNNLDVLRNRKICFLMPERMDISKIKPYLGSAEVKEVSSDWLGRKRGFVGYNEMLTSPDFYSMFSGYEYILICHTDAWIFRDELDEWCSKGYDVVAAPWLMRRRYMFGPLHWQMCYRKWKAEQRGAIHRVHLYGKIGNGGLTLRRVDIFRKLCVENASEIAAFLSKGCNPYNEDVYFALFPKNLRRPTQKEALKFSFDTKPRELFKRNHNKLPMGCHGFMHESRKLFWSRFIPAIPR